MKTTAVICFDLDGTLVESHRDIAKALGEALEDAGRPALPPEAVKKLIGGGVGQLLTNAGLDATGDIFARALRVFQEAYARCVLETTDFYPGVAAMLEELKARSVVSVVATNKPRRFTEAIAAHLGFADRGIAATSSSDEVGARKPNPAVVRLAFEKAHVAWALSSDPRPYYVGDMAIDIESARAADLRPIVVAWGCDPEGGRRGRPAHYVEHPIEIVRIIDHEISSTPEGRPDEIDLTRSS